MASIDVRGIISAGGEPLENDHGCGRSPGRRKQLVTLAHFEPVLLAGVLGSRKFSHDAPGQAVGFGGPLSEILRIAVADAFGGGAAVHLRVGWERPLSLAIIDNDAAAAPGFRINSP